jgi:hypothetical protein
MNQAKAVKITVKTPDDVRKQLEAWAAFNVSSLTAEMIRSVRFRARAERERQEKAVQS